MSELRAVTFDFWSTLVDGTVTPESTAARLARLYQVVVDAGHTCTLAELEGAFHRALERVAWEARETRQDVGPPGRWAVLATELGLAPGLIPYAVVEHAYEDITLSPLPAAMPRVGDAVRGLKSAGYHLGVICNTGMAGGRVLRQVLARHGLLDAFDVLVFSNEFGWSKPDPRIFHHTLAQLGDVPASAALHVGDLEELDVEGARRAGVHAARYVPYLPRPVETDADLVVVDWRDFPRQVAEFSRRGAGSQTRPGGRGDP